MSRVFAVLVLGIALVLLGSLPLVPAVNGRVLSDRELAAMVGSGGWVCATCRECTGGTHQCKQDGSCTKGTLGKACNSALGGDEAINTGAQMCQTYVGDGHSCTSNGLLKMICFENYFCTCAQNLNPGPLDPPYYCARDAYIRGTYVCVEKDRDGYCTRPGLPPDNYTNAGCTYP